MKFERHKSLVNHNTFGLDVAAKEFVEVSSIEDIQSLIKQGVFLQPFFILGGGSNILFTKDFEGTVVQNCIKGIDVLNETAEVVDVFIGGGENWHQTVLHCVSQNWGGIENLSLIPGCVGAAPIQNIGAYGVELKDVVTKVHFIDLVSGDVKSLESNQCQFGYRHSIFKQTLKNKIFITGIELRLTKIHELSLDYGAIQDQLVIDNISEPTIKDVSNAVITIRQSKLPDPAVLGNSGSFFKNPIIPLELFQNIKKTNPSINSYPVDDRHVKIAAGWLIEQCGWKGKKVGNTGSHAKQALVLVNYGGASGNEILSLSKEIIESVKEAFNVTLEPEVNIV